MSDKHLHHHGNLRPALIEAGIEILESEGLSALSLRKVAARVGVSHAAPAHHFKGKDGLLVAIAARAFETFTQAMKDHQTDAADDPRSQLIGLCEGYLHFARQHKAQFELIFLTAKKDNPSEELQFFSREAFNLLVSTCDLFEPAASGPRGNAIMIWSLVHGFATLRENNRMVSQTNGVENTFESILPNLTVKRT